MKLDTVKSTLHDWNLTHQRVLVRADLNVPCSQNAILGTYKLDQIMPTLASIRAHDGITILASHRGRPRHPDPALSTRILVPWFIDHGLTVHFCATLQEAHTCRAQSGDIILLENLRFFDGERPPQQYFAQTLATLGDYFVQDAFGSLHDDDASIAMVPSYFPAHKRSIGLLVEKELNVLTALIQNIRKPFVLIIGGAKIKSKLPFLYAMLKYTTTIVLLPAAAFTFLKALNQPVGTSLVEEDVVDACRIFMHEAAKHHVQLIFPQDYYVCELTAENTLLVNPVAILSGEHVGISCGPRTLAQIEHICLKAKTIMVNGFMGFLNRPETCTSMAKIMEIVATSHATTIIGGGDTAALVEQLHMLEDFSYVSTGGGSLLAFMSNQQLPGLQPFLNPKK